ncbi:hypothetical protein Tco_1325018, partial [Tanacetum coccineum]
FGDSYKAPPEESGKGVAGEGSTKNKGRIMAITAEDMQKRKNDEAILKTFGGNEATKKTRKNQLKQQYGNFKAEGSDTLEQTFNRLQAIVSHLEFMDVPIEQDDLNQKFLTSLAPEWLVYTIVWRNRDDLDTMSLDDVYNHLKVYEPEVQKRAESNSQNIAFMSSSNTNSEKLNLSYNTVCAFIATQPNGSQIKYEDISQIDDDDIKEMDIKWNLELLCMRADRFWKNTGKKITIRIDVAGFDKIKVLQSLWMKTLKMISEVDFTLKNVRSSFEQEKFDKPHSHVKRPFVRKTTVKNKVCVPTARTKFPTVGSKVPTAKPTVAAVKGNRGKAGIPQDNIDDKGYWDSGCSRHMTGNISYLSEYEPYNGGYVSFGHGGGKITGKGTIKTGKLEFENVYFVKELKYNMFSVSQIYNNKNNVLFTDSECLVLGKDYKLVDDTHVLLRTPRQQNMYSIDLKNIVPHKNLTCQIAKASEDESML